MQKSGFNRMSMIQIQRFLKIAFINKHIRTTSEISEEAYTAFGSDAESFITTLANLQAAPSLSEVFLLYDNWIKVEKNSSLTLLITENFHLKFVIGHPKIPFDIEGGINYDRVTYIRITEIIKR